MKKQSFGEYFGGVLATAQNPWTNEIGVSQNCLRENTKIPQSTLSGIISGKIPLSINVALTLEENLPGIDAHQLLSEQLRYKLKAARSNRSSRNNK